MTAEKVIATKSEREHFACALDQPAFLKKLSLAEHVRCSGVSELTCSTEKVLHSGIESIYARRGQITAFPSD